MKITKNWFYKLSEFNTDKILIWDDLNISIFDDLNVNIEIDIWKKSKVEYFWIINNKENVEISFVQNKIWSELNVRYLILSSEENKLKAKIYSCLDADYTKSDVNIISIVWNNWFIDLDWIVQINKWIKKVEWFLSEENIFLWTKWKIKWIPTLLVRSNDVKASHACKMERISDEQLFYLRSRWINKDDSLKIMLEAKTKNHFSSLEKIDEEFYGELVKTILKEIY